MTALQGFQRIIGGLAAFILLGLLPALAADPPALEAVKTIKLTGPSGKRVDHVALDAKRDRLFVANTANNSLDVIDLKMAKVIKSIPGQDTIQGVVYVPESDRVFAALNSGACNIFDGDSFKQLKSHKIPNADNPYHDAKGGVVYVGAADKKLFKIDAKTLEVKGEMTLASAPASIVVEKGRPRMYVNAHVPRQVHVLDTAKFEVQKKYQLEEAGNYPLALDEANKRLFVGCRQEPRLVVLDTETGKMLASVPIPGDIDDLYLDAKRKQIYASCGAGFLVILRETATNKFEVREKLPTMKMARTCLFDAESSRLFVPVPGEKDGPEVRIYRVK
jgi:DNA-binding beta-propeller fold protein YncE